MNHAATIEHVAPPGQPPVAEKTAMPGPRRISVDGGAVGIIGMVVAVFSLGLVAFIHLSNRVESLDAKIERAVTDLRTEIRNVDAKVDRLGERVDRLDAKIDRLSERMDRLSEKMDRQTEKLTELILSQGQNRGN